QVYGWIQIYGRGHLANFTPLDLTQAFRSHFLAKEKGVGIAFLDVEEESIECYVLIAKPTSRADDRQGGAVLKQKNGDKEEMIQIQEKKSRIVKENQENDKIGSKPDKNGKRMVKEEGSYEELSENGVLFQKLMENAGKMEEYVEEKEEIGFGDFGKFLLVDHTSLHAARRLHNAMLNSILRAPMATFRCAMFGYGLKWGLAVGKPDGKDPMGITICGYWDFSHHQDEYLYKGTGIKEMMCVTDEVSQQNMKHRCYGKVTEGESK
nr:ABC transporter C family member 2-like [Tanacetum cinerariifolium]